MKKKPIKIKGITALKLAPLSTMTQAGVSWVRSAGHPVELGYCAA